jgi:hypothetical protein
MVIGKCDWLDNLARKYDKMPSPEMAAFSICPELSKDGRLFKIVRARVFHQLA